MSSVTRYALAAIVSAAASALPLTAHATPGATYSGTVTGVWSNPLLSGTLIDAATGTLSATDNSGTADCSVGCPNNTNPAPGASTIHWGSSAGSSSIIFFGLPFSNMPLDTTFQFGDLIYTNGTSALQTLIFGATLTLSFGNPDVTDLAAPLGLITTNNTGSPAQNADFVDFRPALSVTFNVLEGQTAVADVFGHLTGDPMPVIDFITLDPTSVPGAGFVGLGIPVPEPMSAVLFATGLALTGITRRVRRG